MTLKLEYAFIPTPYPIRASVGGANPNSIDLRVTLSPSGSAATLSEIQIQIPVGDATDPRDLSAAPSLPQPAELSGADGWSFSVDGSVITLLGADDGTAISGPLSFTLPDIAVSEVEGTVPITVTEYPPDGGKVMDDTTYTLFKEKADYPISNFWADPPALSDLDQTVTLYWTCTDQGQDYVYSVQSDSWQPRNCLDGGQCYSCADGAGGIPTPPLTETTTFTLYVIGTDGTDRRIASTLQLTVPVLVPSISQNSFVEQIAVAGGCFASVHWVAYNAAYCSVLVDTTTVVSQAPADTYLDGYIIYLGDEGTHQVSVVAHAAEGSAIATLQLGEWAVEGAGYQVSTQLPPVSVAATPDGTQALVACNDGRTVVPQAFILPIDLGDGSTQPTLPVIDPASIVLSRDWSVGAVFSPAIPAIEWLSPDGSPPAGFPVGTPMLCGAFTPGADALLAGLADGTLGWVDAFTFDPDGTVAVGGTPGAVAVAAPDGAPAVALVAVPSANQVVVVDVDTFTVEDAGISVPGLGALAVTADGALALVTLPAAGAVGVIDVAARTLESATISIGGTPGAIAVTPDGALAFVADPQNSRVVVIDLARRATVGDPIAVPTGPTALAVGGDGGHLVVACSSNTVLVL